MAKITLTDVLSQNQGVGNTKRDRRVFRANPIPTPPRKISKAEAIQKLSDAGIGKSIIDSISLPAELFISESPEAVVVTTQSGVSSDALADSIRKGTKTAVSYVKVDWTRSCAEITLVDGPAEIFIKGQMTQDTLGVIARIISEGQKGVFNV